MASSSSSSSSLALIWLYHVFLSFRGEDVRKGFLSHVLKEFKSKGINVFIDNEIKRGESVGPELVKAIRHSRVGVVLLSRNYASSSWCLDELVEIMKCREEVGQTVMTIFYNVDPSEVRKQTGDFGKAFDETCVGRTEEVKRAWRQALNDVASIAGYDASNCDNEADLINKVASKVMAVLGFTPSKDFDDFVGIEARIMEIKSKLILQSEEVKVIGIFGPAGIGKTTTARVLYNQLSPYFQFNTFLKNIRGSYEKPCGNDYDLKLNFQKSMLCQIFNKEDIEVRHLGRAQEMLSDKKVLVVLDEVDNWWQLEEMAKQPGWVGPGSIIIITTEDRKLFKALGLGIDHIYEMKYPTSKESLQIFCQYAFGQKSPDQGFESLAREVTWLAGDLPLGLRVMGSYLRGMSRDGWIEALPWLRSTLDREIESTLRFSYNALRDNERTLFLHLACLFAGIKVDRFKSCPLRIWPSKFSCKFLVELIMQYSKFEMLWKGIKPLPCLKILDLSSSQNLKKIPDLSEATSLEVLCLHKCKSLLELTSSVGNATKLYRLDIRGCRNIKDFPNVSDSILELELCETGITEVPPWIESLYRLRKLIMCGCEQLKTVSPNISKLENLEFLHLTNYDLCDAGDHYNEDNEEIYYNENLFAARIEWGPDFKRSWRLRSDLDIHYILQISLPEKALTSSLHLRSFNGMKTIPECIRRLSGLIKLDVKECRRLQALPSLPDSLQFIDAEGCHSLKRIESSFRNPNICLNFFCCYHLNQKARKLIQTSACKYAVLPGEEVPAHFTHRASSGSLTINLTPRPLPSSFRFKACILLSKVYDQPGDNNDDDDDEDDDNEEGQNSLKGMSYSIRGKHNGLTVEGESNQIHIPALYRPSRYNLSPYRPDLSEYREHVYIFEDFFYLTHDCPEAEETTFSELTFEFIVHDKPLKDEEGGDGDNNKVVENDDVMPHSSDGKKKQSLLVYNLLDQSAFRFATSSPHLPLCDIKSSAQEQIDYMITEDDDAPLLIADEGIKFFQCLEEVTSENGLSLKMVVSDLSWVFQILTKMEMVRDFVVTWVETSEKLVKVVEEMETAAETVEIREMKRLRMVKLWLPFVRETKPLVDSIVTDKDDDGEEDKEEGVRCKIDGEIWQALESSFVSIILALPSSDQAEILTEWLSKNGVYPDLTEAFEVWCYRSKVAKRRLGLLGGEEDRKGMS
uniref:ADP-ribosyl cyclase/cyclic ADP-ribose hydrolase n=1 Tax=Brassica rapa subsp. pekinensis TaxID=51351 RepID=D1GEG2_BRARP|nr:disease resistance protein [Brassica rapa subsp. pekinensis]